MIDTMKGATRSRTVWFSLALVVATAVSEHFGVLRPFLKEYGDLVGGGLAVVVAVLRFATDGPLAAKVLPRDDPPDQS